MPFFPMKLEDGDNVLALCTIIKRHLSPGLNTLCSRDEKQSSRVLSMVLYNL